MEKQKVGKLGVQIVKFVDEYQPGIVECHLIDANGLTHVFVEKVPIVTHEDLWSDSSYPRQGLIDCEIKREWTDLSGRSIAEITTQRPWNVESVNGSSVS